MNVLNGGRHAEGGLAIQEYMIVPVSATSFAGAMRMASETYHALGAILREDGYRISLGDEGGFAPALESDEEALRYLVRAIEFAGYEPGKDLFLALDVAANEWYEKGQYRPLGSSRRYSSDGLAGYYGALLEKYPILSIEDPFAEEDFEAFSAFTRDFGKQLQIVGDDLFVTNEKRLEKGVSTGCCNCVLIKPNQVGTLSETAATVALAKRHGYGVMLSHRSGDTEDSALADLAVAFSSGMIKAGAPARSERLAKYNRLLEIEDELGADAFYG
jgi:enolase